MFLKFIFLMWHKGEYFSSDFKFDENNFTLDDRIKGKLVMMLKHKASICSLRYKRYKMRNIFFNFIISGVVVVVIVVEIFISLLHVYSWKLIILDEFSLMKIFILKLFCWYAFLNIIHQLLLFINKRSIR